jgi:hypothetical protein
MLVALMARSVALNVLGRQRNLEVVILAESGVRVPTCNGCKTVRTKEAQLPRELVRLPVEVTQDGIFNKRGIPVFLCEFCDAYELEAALAAHEKRIDNK